MHTFPDHALDVGLTIRRKCSTWRSRP